MVWGIFGAKDFPLLFTGPRGILSLFCIISRHLLSPLQQKGNLILSVQVYLSVAPLLLAFPTFLSAYQCCHMQWLMSWASPSKSNWRAPSLPFRYPPYLIQAELCIRFTDVEVDNRISAGAWSLRSEHPSIHIHTHTPRKTKTRTLLLRRADFSTKYCCCHLSCCLQNSLLAAVPFVEASVCMGHQNPRIFSSFIIWPCML